jgi:hypothetical protein
MDDNDYASTSNAWLTGTGLDFLLDGVLIDADPITDTERLVRE